MLGHVAEARHLVVLSRQRVDGVKDEIDQTETAVDVHVLEVPKDNAHIAAPFFSPQLGHHLLGGIDALNLESSFDQRKRDSAGSDRKLQDRAPTGSLRQEING